MKYLLLQLLLISALANGQALSFYQDQFNGGVTGCGYGPSYEDAGTGTLTISIAPGSTIKHAWLIAGREGVTNGVTVTLNGTNVTFNSTNQYTTFYSEYGGSAGVHVADVSQLIDPSVNTYTLVSPYQPDGPDDLFTDYYLYVAYANDTMPLVTTSIFLNQGDDGTSITDSFIFQYPIENTSPAGLAVFMGYACADYDYETVTVNGTALGNIYGPNSNSGLCSGPYGDFAYQDGVLSGLLDGNANQAMSGADALSNIQGLVSECDTSVSVTFTHTDSDNSLWAFFFTYSGTATAAVIDTAVCSGVPVQLNSSNKATVWTPATNLSCNNCANPTATLTASASYVATFAGCNSSVSDTFNITISSDTLSLQASPATICAGDTVHLSAGGEQVTWSPAGLLSCTTCASAASAPTVSQVYYATGKCSAPDSILVNVNALPAASIAAGGPTTFCPGDSVLLSAITGGTAYLWSNGQTTQSIYAGTAGSFTVTVSNANNCSAASAATVITFSSAPSAVVTASGPLSFCAGDSVVLTAAAGADLYQWSDGETTQVITSRASGNYTVSVSNGGGCTAVSQATVITVNQPPAPAITPGGPTTFCPGDSVTLVASTATSYLWSNGQTTQSITVNANGSFTVTASNGNNCSGASPATVVTVSNPPDVSVTAGGPVTFCGGSSVDLIASPAGLNYLWSTGQTTQTISVTAGGNITVTVSNSDNCSVAAPGTLVTVLPSPVTTVTTSGSTTFCKGDTIVLTAAAGGTTYLWNTGQTTQSIMADSSGIFSVTVTGENNCSAASTNIELSATVRPTITIISSGPLTFCQGESITITGYGGIAYQWSNGATSAAINVSSSDTVSLSVTFSGGCQGSSEPLITKAVPLPQVSIIADTNQICSNDSVLICTSAGFENYRWNTGQTDSCIAAYQPGVYFVNVGDSAGCHGQSAELNLIVNQPPSTSITQAGDTLQAYDGAAYQWYYNGQILPDDTSAYLLAKNAGSYWVQITSPNGCQAKSSPVIVTGLTELNDNYISIYPNPTTGHWKLVVDTRLMGGMAEILDVSGQIVYKFIIENIESEIDFNASSGVYLLRLNKNGYTNYRKLVKI